MFVDEMTLTCRGGDGGDGCMSFRKEAHVPRGGPDGGDGGNGGQVILEATENLTNLAHLIGETRKDAGRGGHGQGKKKTGARGDDIVVIVPMGTLVYDADRGNLLRDMSQHGEQLIVARGGRGGRGNFKFMSSTNRAPREHERGQPGSERTIRMELKVIADVGLIGKPNAGKSTLLSRLTRATPEIASYPFTTKYPNLGMFRLGYDQAFVIADIPGLIEGAHAGVGLGHDFLKHVERTKVFLHLVEPEPADETDPVTNYATIREELRLYNEKLASRPELIVVTKCELPDADEIATQLRESTGRPVIQISAVTGKGLPELTREIVELMKNANSKVPVWEPPEKRRM
jgi:GTP-binding protein